MKKIVVINASPRKGWNTDQLVTAAANGAEEAGAEVVKFDLYRLEKFTGCISCFGCKREGHEGVCIYKDGLAPVLEAIREADALILGTPNYLGDVSAAFRALYERLIFQSITYQKEKRSYNDRMIPVLLIMTSNTPESAYSLIGYRKTLKGYQKTLETFVGPTKLMAVGNTLQVNDYSRYRWTIFDPEAKQERREKQFPKDLEEAARLGAEMIRQPW